MNEAEPALNLFSRVLGEAGAAGDVLILHGLFAASDNLLRLGKSLSESYRVHLLDLRNHGQSPHTAQMSYEAMADDVLHYVQTNNLKDFSLVGHSMGGKTAMQVALLVPHRIKALVVADIAPVQYPPGHIQILKGLDHIAANPVSSRKQADEALAEFIDDWGVRQFLIKNLRKVDDSGGDGNNALSWRFNLPAIHANYESILSAPDGGQYDGPTLFIAGALSNYILPEHKSQTVALFPNAQLKIIPETSHWLHVEKPEVFNRMCLRFLDDAGHI